MKYRVLDATSIDLLNEIVEDALANGWELQGGVAAIPTAAPHHNFGFYQAVTKQPEPVPFSGTIEFRGGLATLHQPAA